MGASQSTQGFHLAELSLAHILSTPSSWSPKVLRHFLGGRQRLWLLQCCQSCSSIPDSMHHIYSLECPDVMAFFKVLKLMLTCIGHHTKACAKSHMHCFYHASLFSHLMIQSCLLRPSQAHGAGARSIL